MMESGAGVVGCEGREKIKKGRRRAKMWTFEADADRLCGRAVKAVLDLIQQHAELMFHEYDSAEFSGAAEFLRKCKQSFDKEMDERITLMQEKGVQ